MNIADILKIVAIKCGNRDMEEMQEFATPYLKLVQDELESDPFLPWFLKKDFSADVLVPGEISLPEGFLKLAHDSGIWFTQDGQLFEIKLESMKQAIQKFKTQEGVPQVCSLEGNKLYLYPAPSSGSVSFMFYGKEPELGDAPLAQENAWTNFAASYFLGKLGLEVAQDLEHAPGVQFFAQKAEAGREFLFRQDVERQVSGEELRF